MTPPKARAEAVSPQRAAEILAVSEATIRRLIKAGRLKAIRVGRQWRIALPDLRRGTGDVASTSERR